MKNKKNILILSLVLIIFVIMDICLVYYNSKNQQSNPNPQPSDHNYEPANEFNTYRCFSKKEFTSTTNYVYTLDSEYEFSVNLENLKIYNGHFNDTYIFKSKEDFENYAEELKKAIPEDITNQFSYNDSNNTINQNFDITLNSENPLAFSNEYFDYLATQDYTNCQKIN